MTPDLALQGFHFLRPWWLLLLPLLLGLLWYLRRIKLQSSSWQAVCDAALLPHLLMTQGDRHQRRGRLLVIALVGLLAITALAGPTWKQLEQPVFRDQSALVLILDLSRSMDATDVKPTRLTRARLKLIDILKQRKEGQSALIVYAAEAFTVSPLTEDAATIIAQVGSLTTALMPSQGSRPDQAIDLAQQLLVQAGAHRGELLLITDGLENVPADALSDSMEALVQAGYRLSVLGVGHADGAPIILPDGGFLKDRSGAIVIPRLDEVALRELAQQGGGHYQAMRVDDLDIATLLAGSLLEDELLLEVADGFKADQWREEGPWLLLLLLPLVLMGFRRGYLLWLCMVMLPLLSLSPNNLQAAEEGATPIEQSWWSGLWSTPDQRAAQAFDNENAQQAAQLFENREWQAAAHYRSGNYKQSIAALDGIESAEALYNKGNALAQQQEWQAAIDAYDHALRLQPRHEDAQYNREWVQEKLQQQSSDGSQSEQGEEGESSEQNESQQGESQQGEAGQSESQSGEQQGESGSQSESEQQQSSSASDSGEMDEPSDKMDHQQSEDGDESMDEAQMSEAQQNEAGADEESEAPPEEAATASELSEAQAEIQRANDQWLRRIPDDPGGLLRRKFQFQSQRAKNRSGGQPRSEEESW